MTLSELDALHTAFQEIESKGVEPDTTDFDALYSIIESEREKHFCQVCNFPHHEHHD
jgi:hypothetical protein